MKTPLMSKKIKNTDPEVIAKIEKMIEDSLKADYISSYPIEGFNMELLVMLSEYAKVNDLVVTIKANHNNAYQGVLLNIITRDLVKNTTFTKYL